MQTVNIDDARRHFCRLVDAAANGEELPLRKPASPESRQARYPTLKKIGWTTSTYKSVCSVETALSSCATISVIIGCL